MAVAYPSIKCGSVGLNLVSANRVVNMDLSWNYAAESQAYDRVHRLGQEKEVFVKRLVINNTLEERCVLSRTTIDIELTVVPSMLKLQETKTGLAEAALGEGGGVKLHKLSVKELKAVGYQVELSYSISDMNAHSSSACPSRTTPTTQDRNQL